MVLDTSGRAVFNLALPASTLWAKNLQVSFTLMSIIYFTSTSMI